MTVTPNQFLERLAASPKDAAEFDQCAPRGMSRREHVEFTLARVNASCAAVDHSKALAAARLKTAKLKQDIAVAKNRIAVAKAALAAKKSAPSAPANKPTAAAAAPIKPQRELTGIARTAAAFAGTANRSAITTSSNLTGHARTAAAFARQAK